MDSYSESDNLETGEKVILIGDSFVGKTSIVQKYVHNTFSENQKTTIGCDHYEKDVNVEGHGVVKLSIWDTAGQDRFRGLASSYYKQAKCVIVVFDVTKKASFEKLEFWKEEINNFASEKIIKILVGNKVDLGMTEVTEDMAQQYAKQNNMSLLLTSALENLKIEELFSEVAKRIKMQNTSGGGGKKDDESPITGGQKIDLQPEEKKEGGCGC